MSFADALPDPALPVVELEFVGPVAAPFYWVLCDRDGADRFKSGTVFFMDAGSGAFAVTSGHVVEQCLTDSNTPLFVQSMIGGHGKTLYFRVKERPIDVNADIDIATLRFSRDEIDQIGCTILTGAQLSWPPSLAQTDHAVTLCGYPGLSRRLLAPKTLQFGRVALGANVSSVHESCILMLIERDQMYRCLGDRDLPEDYDFGGISGGPVIALAERRGVRSWMPAGVIFQGPNPNTDPAQDAICGLEIFRARPIHFIRQDGFLDASRWQSLHP